jgi:hypothetical protein
MKKRDLIRLLADFDNDADITFDAGGCSGWHHHIDCVASVILGEGSGNPGEHVILLCECDADGRDVVDEYADPKNHETRRRFTDFQILSVHAIERREGGDPNGVLTVLPRAEIDQPDYDHTP